MFGVFILACGTTHLMDIVTVWEPVYLLQGIVKLATAGISLVTATLLIPLLPKALALRSPAELVVILNLPRVFSRDEIEELTDNTVHLSPQREPG